MTKIKLKVGNVWGKSHKMLILTLALLIITHASGNSNEAELKENEIDTNLSGMKLGQKLNDTVSKGTKYFIYEVNPGEGFNLRRDVFVRAANLVKHLRDIEEDVVLVLPPWRHLYHWKSGGPQNAVPWKKFFDIQNINKYVPVIEFNELVKISKSPGIDLIAYLQRHPDGFKNGWEEKIEEAECTDRPVYWEREGKFYGHFWGLENVYGRAFRCVSVQGSAKILANYVQASNARYLKSRNSCNLH